MSHEFKVSSTGETLQYTESKDPKFSVAGIEIHTSRKWSTLGRWSRKAQGCCGASGKGKIRLVQLSNVSIEQGLGQGEVTVCPGGSEQQWKESGSRMAGMTQQWVWMGWKTATKAQMAGHLASRAPEL